MLCSLMSDPCIIGILLDSFSIFIICIAHARRIIWRAPVWTMFLPRGKETNFLGPLFWQALGFHVFPAKVLGGNRPRVKVLVRTWGEGVLYYEYTNERKSIAQTFPEVNLTYVLNYHKWQYSGYRCIATVATKIGRRRGGDVYIYASVLD